MTWTLLAVAALACLGAVAFLADRLFPDTGFSVEATAAYIESYGAGAGIVVVTLMLLHTFVPFPAEILAFAAGLCMGALWGTVCVWCGAMLGAIVAFGLARAFGRPLVVRLLGEARAAAIDVNVERYANAGALIAVRFVPVISFNLVNFAAGLTPVSWGTFLWTTAVGILPLTSFMVLMGERMREPGWLDIAIFSAVALALVAISVAHARRPRG
ncbi:MAG: VTT domain-containing protein [Mesorhizobium sp.]|nr:VTT domain-containing protein [Mesorhizobium sp.]